MRRSRWLGGLAGLVVLGFVLAGLGAGGAVAASGGSGAAGGVAAVRSDPLPVFD
jgi:hypothetical protein